MTFENGHQVNVGRSNPNAGRKRDAIKAEMAAIFDKMAPP
jgi:hypothetical protein